MSQAVLSKAHEESSPEEDAELLTAYHAEEIQNDKLALLFKRTEGEIRSRLKHLSDFAKGPGTDFRESGRDIDNRKKPIEDVWVKGKISESGDKTYYLPGEALYLTIEPDAWFATEEHALKAGFRKSG